MPDANWYEAMGKAMAKREKCLNAINRWTADLAEVEAEIEALRTGNEPPETVQHSDPAPSMTLAPGPDNISSISNQ